MEKLFEAFVEWYLVKNFSDRFKVSAQVHRNSFARDKANKSISSVQPDFILESDKKLIVADAKWKLPESLAQISPSDLYQLYSHKAFFKKGKENIQAYSCLFYPKTDYLSRRQTLTYFDDEKLIICPLDLARELGVFS